MSELEAAAPLPAICGWLQHRCLPAAADGDSDAVDAVSLSSSSPLPQRFVRLEDGCELRLMADASSSSLTVCRLLLTADSRIAVKEESTALLLSCSSPDSRHPLQHHLLIAHSTAERQRWLQAIRRALLRVRQREQQQQQHRPQQSLHFRSQSPSPYYQPPAAPPVSVLEMDAAPADDRRRLLLAPVEWRGEGRKSCGCCAVQ